MQAHTRIILPSANSIYILKPSDDRESIPRTAALRSVTTGKVSRALPNCCTAQRINDFTFSLGPICVDLP